MKLHDEIYIDVRLAYMFRKIFQSLCSTLRSFSQYTLKINKGT